MPSAVPTISSPIQNIPQRRMDTMQCVLSRDETTYCPSRSVSHFERKRHEVPSLPSHLPPGNLLVSFCRSRRSNKSSTASLFRANHQQRLGGGLEEMGDGRCGAPHWNMLCPACPSRRLGNVLVLGSFRVWADSGSCFFFFCGAEVCENRRCGPSLVHGKRRLSLLIAFSSETQFHLEKRSVAARCVVHKQLVQVPTSASRTR